MLENMRVLYVEDNEDIREELAETLEFDVKELFIAENGEEGLEKFKKYKPDIVITDIKMPKMDGLKMSAEIKKISPTTPIIITTAFSDASYLIKAIEIGIDRYVTKPIDIDKLYQKLEEIATLYSIEKEREIRNKYLRNILDFNPNFILVTKNKEVQYINKTFLNFLECPDFETFKKRITSIDNIVKKITDTEGNLYPTKNWINQIINNPHRNHIIYFIKHQDTPFVVLQNSFKDLNKDILIFSDITNLELNRLKLQSQIKNLSKENELKDKMLKVQSKNALMGEMIASIAHQLKQPLNALSLNVSMLEIDECNEDDLKFCIENTKKQIHYMSKTITNFRNFLSPNKLIEEFSINDTFNEVIELIEKELKLKSIEVEILNCDIKIVNNKNNLEQVLMNIIKNAMDAFDPKKENNKIVINCKNVEDRVLIKIKDNAGGIDKEILSKIFEPYFTTKETGTGIGLYISEILLKDMDGNINVNSENGETIFVITIPKEIK